MLRIHSKSFIESLGEPPIAATPKLSLTDWEKRCVHPTALRWKDSQLGIPIQIPNLSSLIHKNRTPQPSKHNLSTTYHNPRLCPQGAAVERPATTPRDVHRQQARRTRRAGRLKNRAAPRQNAPCSGPRRRSCAAPCAQAGSRDERMHGCRSHQVRFGVLSASCTRRSGCVEVRLGFGAGWVTRRG